MRRQVTRIPATAASSSRKPGTIAIVPPTLAPNPGQPEATTANSAIALTASTARRRSPGSGSGPAAPSAVAAQAASSSPAAPYTPSALLPTP